MHEDTAAFVVPTHPIPRKPNDKTGAARAKAYRQRKKQLSELATSSTTPSSECLVTVQAKTGSMVRPTSPSAYCAIKEPAVTPWSTALPSSGSFAGAILITAALTLGAAGIAINGWFARSLGSSDAAAWLFLVVGMAADLAALVLPSTAVGIWKDGQRRIALVGWSVWLVTFVFAVTAGIGFASTNISDMTLMRASRVTPAITSAQIALVDATAARDRECKGGVGKFCREREALVAERRQILDAAMMGARQGADPQTDAAIKLVAWISRGMLRPVPEDFAMVRLIFLALLPQIGGMLLLIRRRSQTSGGSGI